MAEKQALQSTHGTPAGSLPNLKRLQGPPTFQTPQLYAALLLVDTAILPLVPGHVDMGTRLLRLKRAIIPLKRMLAVTCAD